MEFSRDDFTDIESFCLSFQGIGLDHTRFQPDDLEQIRLLTAIAARRETVKLQQRMFDGNSEQAESFFYCGALRFDAAGDPEDTRSWLDKILPIGHKDLIVAWDIEVAIVVNRDLFVQQWQKLCFPTSDSADIWHPDANFLLHFDKDAVFSIKAVSHLFHTGTQHHEQFL